MKGIRSGWRAILGIVLVVVLLGGLCIGVGFLTGGDLERIVENLNSRYQLQVLINTYTGWFTGALHWIGSLF